MPLQLNYLISTEYSKFGLPTSTTDDQVSRASDIVDAYLQRTEGMLWSPDSAGNPMCMTRKSPTSARTLAGSIVPGMNIPVQLSPGPILTSGDALVINRTLANAHVSETCTILGITDNNNVTLTSVVGAHSAGEVAETGLVVEETLTLPKNRTVVQVGKGPIATVCSALGRITYGRRTDSTTQMQDYALFQAASAFGQAPVWQVMPFTNNNNVDRYTNQIWCPVGIMMIPYTEVKFNYIAGYIAAGLPPQIKQATANIVIAIAEAPASPNIKFFKAGETQMTRFLSSVIDSDTEKLLAPFMARNYV